jgi:hypothetical protein
MVNSAITQEEFEAAREQAVLYLYNAGILNMSNAEADTFLRKFFEALPADVKLMRREPTDTMTDEGAKHHLPKSASRIEATRGYRAMHDAAPPSLPKEGES